MVEASVFAAAGSFEASQRSAMDRTSSGSIAVRGRGQQLQSLLGAPRVPQHRGLQVLRPDVQRVGIDRAVHEIERRGHVAARGGDLGQRIVAGGLPCLAPGRLDRTYV